MAAFIDLLSAWPSAARDVHDDFKSLPLDANWFVCQRKESEFEKLPATANAPARLRLTAKHRTAPVVAMMAVEHADCDIDREPRERFERAELWEHSCDFEPFGTEVWQGFRFMLDPAAPPAPERLVIGQWKQGKGAAPPLCASTMTGDSEHDVLARAATNPDGGPSPFIAQRFVQNIFTVTVEQADRRAGHLATDQRRAELAADAHRAQDALIVLAQGAGTVDELFAPVAMRQAAGEGAPLAPNAADLAATCLHGLSIERFAPLPEAFGRWVTMKYHFKVGARDDDFVEVWANGTLVARARGAMSTPEAPTLDSSGPHTQYFKFGPYRNPAREPNTVFIADYWKVHSAADAPPP